ncbi:TPA: replication factor C large subunit [archaeon]|uniref:Replication factor C large subunit n=1 Tax=Candidatus Naiadarchaeum limnaeum TaxID=2756139 RepID=A0A832UZB3_9ARCH|nr:replication factor C large subunit [Candidatus Naiadarchaeum limnaeum]
MEKDFSLLNEKYRPQKLRDIAGQDTAIQDLLKWIKNFKKEKNRAIILHGPSGNGKTALAQALANELTYELIQMNASDFRTEKTIMEKIGHAVSQQSLVQKKGKIVLIDEIDGIYGTSDRGGISALQKIIRTTNYPIILTANDIWIDKLRFLRLSCKLIQMRKVDLRTIVKRLKEIAETEGVKIKEAILHEIARRAEGDLRAAINDLQTLGMKKVDEKDLELISWREKEIPIFETLLAIFKSKDWRIIQKAFSSSDKTPDEILMWIAENIPNEYEKPEEIAAAYNMLSRADVFRGRIIHNQAWGLQAFSNELMTFGVAAAKKEKYRKFTRYVPPKILQKMGASKGERAARDEVAFLVGKKLHCSKKRTIEQFPYLSLILKKKSLDLPLDEEQIRFLKNYT